jgi:hypothetical protein
VPGFTTPSATSGRHRPRCSRPPSGG